MRLAAIASLAGVLAISVPALAQQPRLMGTSTAPAGAVSLITPAPGAIIGPTEPVIEITGAIAPGMQADCCVFQLSYYHLNAKPGPDGKDGKWTVMLKQPLALENVPAGVALDPDQLIASALNLSDPTDAKTYALNSEALTTDKVTRWEAALVSPSDGTVFARREFGLRGRAGMAAPAPQFAPQNSAEDNEAPATPANMPTSPEGPRAKQHAQALAALQARNEGRTDGPVGDPLPLVEPQMEPQVQPMGEPAPMTQSEPMAEPAPMVEPAPVMDPARIDIVAPRSAVKEVIETDTFPLQISLSSPGASAQCCMVEMWHYAIITLPDGSTQSDWFKIDAKPIPGAALEGGVAVNWTGLVGKAEAQYRENEARFEAQLKRFQANTAELWRVDVLPLEGAEIEADSQTLVLKP